MSIYLILQVSQSEKRLHVFSFECDTKEINSVILLFTSRHSAEDYMSLAGWTSEYVIEQIEPTELLKRLIYAKQHGVTHVAVDPKREEQLQGLLPRVQMLDDAYAVHADVLRQLSEKLGATAIS